MKMLIGAGIALSGLIACASVAAQTPAEVVTLAAANVATPQKALAGGNYLFAQACAGWGTGLLLQSQWPDGSWVTLATKTAADTSALAIQFGPAAIVRVVLQGTTGCYATLSRVPY